MTVCSEYRLEMWSRLELKCSSSTLPLTCHMHTHTCTYTTPTHIPTTHTHTKYTTHHTHHTPHMHTQTHTTHTTHTCTHTHNTHECLQAVWSHICNRLGDHQGGDEQVRYAILQKSQLRFTAVHLFKFMSINLQRHHPRLCNLLSSTLFSPQDAWSVSLQGML